MRRSTLLFLSGVASALVGCSESPSPTGTAPTAAEGQLGAKAASGTGTPKGRGPRPAYPLMSTRPTLEQTAAVVEGTVTAISYSFDDQLGPRTNVTFGSLASRVGSLKPSTTLTLPFYGGPSADGTSFYAAAHVARFVQGAKYVLFLANHDWFFSPVLSNNAFRVETVGGRDILVDSDGMGVTGVSVERFERTGAQITESAGLDRRNPFAAPKMIAAAASPEVTACMGKESFISAVGAYSEPGMAATAFDGSFLPAPQPWVWNNMPTMWSSAGGTPVSDAGLDQ